MKTIINKILGIGALGLALAGCSKKFEKCETKWIYMNPESYKNTEVKYNADSTQIILPTNIVSYIGSTETYGNAKHPRIVSIGGQGRINGVGYDFNEDGIFDKLEKSNPTDNFTFIELEKTLNKVKEKAKNITDRNMISESEVLKNKK